MSINKAQGQTLKRVGLYLPNPVFSHGQLYVALSRVSRPENITIFIDGTKDTHGEYRGKMYTKNFVYGQLLREEIKKFTEGETYIGEYPNFDGIDESEDESEYPNYFGPQMDEPHMDPDLKNIFNVVDSDPDPMERSDFSEPEFDKRADSDPEPDLNERADSDPEPDLNERADSEPHMDEIWDSGPEPDIGGRSDSGPEPDIAERSDFSELQQEESDSEP